MCFRGGRWQQGVSRGTSRCGNLAPRAYAANSNLPELRNRATGKKTARVGQNKRPRGQICAANHHFYTPFGWNLKNRVPFRNAMRF